MTPPYGEDGSGYPKKTSGKSWIRLRRYGSGRGRMDLSKSWQNAVE
jgi:hypothetical protein